MKKYIKHYRSEIEPTGEEKVTLIITENEKDKCITDTEKLNNLYYTLENHLTAKVKFKRSW